MKKVFCLVPLEVNMTTLTESEEAIPGETELLPWFGDDGSEPLGDGPGIHGCLEGAEHEVQRGDVVLGFLGNLIFQTA